MHKPLKQIYEEDIVIIVKPYQKGTLVSGVTIEAIKEDYFHHRREIPLEQVEMVDRDVLALIIEDAISNVLQYAKETEGKI